MTNASRVDCEILRLFDAEAGYSDRIRESEPNGRAKQNARGLNVDLEVEFDPKQSMMRSRPRTNANRGRQLCQFPYWIPNQLNR